MKLHIPGTSIDIKVGEKSKKKKVLDEAYKRVLRSPASDQTKVTWPEMPMGTDLWYDDDQEGLRRATAAGLMHNAEDAVPNGVKNYQLKFDMPDPSRGEPVATRAFSSSAGLVNMPSTLAGYMSKPQYLATVLAHEVAHNNDWRKNHPALAHSIETFRPLEKMTNAAAMIEPQYDPGTDVTGKNEYADRYASLGPWKDQYFLSANQMDPTRQIFPVSTDKLAREIINRRNITRSGPTNSGGYKNVPGSGRGFSI